MRFSGVVGVGCEMKRAVPQVGPKEQNVVMEWPLSERGKLWVEVIWGRRQVSSSVWH